MRRYLLDSDILSYLQQKDSPFYGSVHERISRLDDDDEVVVSMLSLYEIFYGISWGPEEDRDYLMQSIASIEETFSVANLTRRGAEIFGDIGAGLRNWTPNRMNKDKATGVPNSIGSVPFL